MKHTLVFTFSSFGVVANCGGEERVLHFPMRLFPFRTHATPAITGSYDLIRDVELRVFGPGAVFTPIADRKQFEPLEQIGSDDEMAGEQMIPELRSGSFDQALWDVCKKSACADQGFKSVLANYEFLARRSHPSVTWVGELPGQALKNVTPPYPQLAKQARIEGDVDLEIQVDYRSGRVVDATPISGHPLLRNTAVGGARSLEFKPGTLPEGVSRRPVKLRFQLNCNKAGPTTPGPR
jgi:TonB family protein